MNKQFFSESGFLLVDPIIPNKTYRHKRDPKKTYEV